MVPGAEAPRGDAVDIPAGVGSGDVPVFICAQVAEACDVAAMAHGGSASDDTASAIHAVPAEEAEFGAPIASVAEAVTRLAAAGRAAAGAPVHVDGRSLDLVTGGSAIPGDDHHTVTHHLAPIDDAEHALLDIGVPPGNVPVEDARRADARNHDVGETVLVVGAGLGARVGAVDRPVEIHRGTAPDVGFVVVEAVAAGLRPHDHRPPAAARRVLA